MDVQAQAVSQAVGKKTAEAGLLDDGAGFGIDVRGLRAGADRGDAAPCAARTVWYTSSNLAVTLPVARTLVKSLL